MRLRRTSPTSPAPAHSLARARSLSRRRLPVALLALAGALLAGCQGPGSGPAGGDGDGPGPYRMDGEAAYGFVAGLVQEADGDARPRVPGTPQHAEAAAWLWEAMQVPGWSVRWQNFTGAQYLALDHGAVSDYFDPFYCSQEERDRVEGLSFHNLVATYDLPGAGGAGEERWWLGAHWESKRYANQDPDSTLRQEPVLGANDGASGVGVLLQIMRDVADGRVQPVASLGVALFDGEDGFEDCHPLAGSLWFVERLGDSGAPAASRFLLLDMVGDPNARFVREKHSLRCAAAVVDLLWSKAPAYGLAENFPDQAKDVTDDHVPFVEAGIPAVDLIDFGRPSGQGIFGFPPYWHTTADTLDNISAEMIGKVGSLVGDVLDEPSEVETPCS